MTIQPFQSKDRQLNAFNDQTIAEVATVYDRIGDRCRIVRWLDFKANTPGNEGDRRIVDEWNGGGEWVYDAKGVWRPLVSGVICRRPPPVAYWHVASTTNSSFVDKFGQVHMAAFPGEGRSGGRLALTVGAFTRWSVVAGFAASLANSDAASENAGFGVFALNTAGEFAVSEYNGITSTTASYPRMLFGYGTTMFGGVAFTSSTQTTTPMFGGNVYLRILLVNGLIVGAGGPSKTMNWAPSGGTALATVFPSGNPTLCGIYVFTSAHRGNWAECFHLEQVAA